VGETGYPAEAQLLHEQMAELPGPAVLKDVGAGLLAASIRSLRVWYFAVVRDATECRRRGDRREKSSSTL